MVKIDEEDNRVIHLTRGDKTTGKINRLAFKFPIYNAKTKEKEYYEFKLDDKIAFIVMSKKGYTKNEILRKEYTPRDLGYIEADKPTSMEIPLTPEDTKKFPLKNKKATYWYDIVLNDDITIGGYSEDGASKIIVYPESGEIGE